MNPLHFLNKPQFESLILDHYLLLFSDIVRYIRYILIWTKAFPLLSVLLLVFVKIISDWALYRTILQSSKLNKERFEFRKTCLFCFACVQCSTLMLIESAKDSLRFSVTHYKHPKQPHTVQVSLRSRHTNDPFSLFFVFALIMCHFLTVRQFIVFALIIRHCVSQARTVEEKKLWAHHIKRLILENHHAVIPQKVRTVTGPQISVWISDTVINMICYLDQGFLNVFISQTLFNSDIYLKFPWDLKLIFQWFNTTFTVLW